MFTRIIRDGDRITMAEVEQGDGSVAEVEADHFISSMGLQELVQCISPPPPQEVLEAPPDEHKLIEQANHNNLTWRSL